MYTFCMHGGYQGALQNGQATSLNTTSGQDVVVGGALAHPIQPHLQHCPHRAAGSSNVPLFLHCWAVACPLSGLSFPFDHRQAPTPSSRRRCTGRPGDEACSPPCAGGVLFHWSPHRWAACPSSCCANAGAPPLSQPSLQAQPGPLRSETRSDTRIPLGRRLRAFPCWKLAASTESLRLSWRQGKPRGRSVYPGPHSRSLPLGIKSEHPPATQEALRSLSHTPAPPIPPLHPPTVEEQLSASARTCSASFR